MHVPPLPLYLVTSDIPQFANLQTSIDKPQAAAGLHGKAATNFAAANELTVARAYVYWCLGLQDRNCLQRTCCVVFCGAGSGKPQRSAGGYRRRRQRAPRDIRTARCCTCLVRVPAPTPTTAWRTDVSHISGLNPRGERETGGVGGGERTVPVSAHVACGSCRSFAGVF
jgi:hypothetical protein